MSKNKTKTDEAKAQSDVELGVSLQKGGKLVQSYIEEKYFVSTMYRRSSAMTETPIWYYETMVWEWDKETRQRKPKILDQVDSGGVKDWALKSHFDICRALLSD